MMFYQFKDIIGVQIKQKSQILILSKKKGRIIIVGANMDNKFNKNYL